MGKKSLWLLPVLAGGAALGVLAVHNPTTSAQTAPDADDERSRTRRYNAPLTEVEAELSELIPKLKTYGANWRMKDVESYDEGTSRASVVLRVEVPVLIFIDDLTITLHLDGESTLVDARSQARVAGKSDLGENRRHLIQLLIALDAQIAT